MLVDGRVYQFPQDISLADSEVSATLAKLRMYALDTRGSEKRESAPQLNAGKKAAIAVNCARCGSEVHPSEAIRDGSGLVHPKCAPQKSCTECHELVRSLLFMRLDVHTYQW